MKKKNSHHDLSQGSLFRHILRMAPPMVVALVALKTFQLTDTWFVSRLGTKPLAAMGFVFPLSLLFLLSTIGLGIGMASCVSRALGAKDRQLARRYVTNGLSLTFALFVCFTFLAYLFLDPVLRALGAEGDTLRLAREYMVWWLLFNPLGALPMVANNAIRATGDSIHPALSMCGGAIFNLILDPILIFGWGPIPAFGMAGAGFATGAARLVPLAISFYFLHARYGLFTRQWAGWQETLRECRQILKQSIPPAATGLLGPLTMGYIIQLIARHSKEAVAGTAAGIRVEQFVYVIPMAIGSFIIPMVGQNWGSNRIDRVRHIWTAVSLISFVYSLFMMLLFLPLAYPLSGLFSENPEVRHFMTRYLWITLTGGILLHPAIHGSFVFNGIGEPGRAAILNVIRIAALAVPLGTLGFWQKGPIGAYLGICAANLVSGTLAFFWVHRRLKGHQNFIIPKPEIPVALERPDGLEN